MSRSGITAIFVVLAAVTLGFAVYAFVAPEAPVAQRLSMLPRTSTLTGFVSTHSGELRRVADVQILVVARTEDFEQEWQREVETFANEYRAATGAIADALEAYEQARAQTDAAFRSARGFDDGFRAYDAARKRRLEMAQRHDDLVAGRTSLLMRHEKEAEDVLRRHSTASTRTDGNGHYQIGGLNSGRYRVFAAHQVFDDRLHWLLAVDLNGEMRKLDLSNSNEGWPVSAAPKGEGSP
jgi:hypothetical protein